MTTKNIQAPEHPLRRGNETPSLQTHDVNPLTFWRTLPCGAFDRTSLAQLRTALQTTSLLHEPRWPDAVRGDPVAAVGIAATLLPVKSIVPITDIIMSALCLNALRGSSGSALVLAHALKTLGNDRPHLKRIGTSWLARDLALGLSQHQRSGMSATPCNVTRQQQ